MSDFIRTIVAEDLETQKHNGQVTTRFPPEPNGFLHIGHAKSICLNFGVAAENQGQCHLRFDDTNPEKEETKYVESIQRDVKWLGFDWGDNLFFASDYFDRLYEFALELIKAGKAYVDSDPEDEIKRKRGGDRSTGTVQPGEESPFRNRSVEENLALFEQMRSGALDEGVCVLRAKIDMAHPNMQMRDPLLYRIRKVSHHRTGDKWCIYPLYDFTHCLSDAIEHITHSLCTLEFEDNRAIYDWVLDNVETKARPHQYEFAPLKLTYTLISKRRLLHLVKEGIVSGWDDPRMPTLAGMRRRGYTPESIRELCRRVGVSRSDNVVEIEQLESCLRDDLNHRSPRVMAIMRPLKLVIENYPEDSEEMLDASYWPPDIDKEGSRKVPFSRELYIERSDFMESPPKKYHRLAPGKEVRLRYAYFVTCTKVIKDDSGEVTEIRCTYDPQTRGGESPDGRKVKGTIHWVSAKHAVDAEVRLYDRLFAHESPSNDAQEFLTQLNPNSLETITAKLEPSLAQAKSEDRFQFERTGYFYVDPVDSKDGKPTFNRTIALRDSWAKQTNKQTKAAPANKTAEKSATKTPKSSPKKSERTEDLGEQYPKYKGMGLSHDDARVLSLNAALQRLFEEGLEKKAAVKTLTSLVVNELPRALRDAKWEDVTDLSALPFGGAALAELVELLEANTISSKASKDVLATLVKDGGEPKAIVKAKGLEQISDAGAIEAIVDEVLKSNPDSVARYREGKRNLMGFFVGQIMKASRGKANPKMVNALLQKKLDA